MPPMIVPASFGVVRPPAASPDMILALSLLPPFPKKGAHKNRETN